MNRRQAGPEIDEAAGDLASCIGRCTGVAVEPAMGARRLGIPGAPVLHLGRDSWVEARIGDLDDLDADGFAIETIDPWNLVIAGPTPRGTRHGVMEFIETALGVRWLLPGPLGEHAPRRDRLSPGEIHVRKEPAFLSRTQPGLSTPAQKRWGRRQRLHERLCGATHSLQSIFAPRKYAASHPHFYPVVDGRRRLDPRGWDWHPCFLAEGLAAEAARAALAHFRAHPEDRCFSLAVADGAVHCECRRCLADEGGRRNRLGMRHVSERYFRWANQVAEGVAAEFPDRLLGVLAYANLFDPPSFPVHPNIVVFHTYDRHKWIHPLLEEEGRRLTEAWRARCRHLAWYDYTFGGPLLAPRIYHRRMAANYRYARTMGVEGITAETCHNWAEAPKYYLLARLQWDPGLDVDALLEEWYRLAVGERAAAPLARCYDHWEEVWEQRLPRSAAFSLRAQQWLPIQDDSYLDVMRPEDFETSRALLQETVAAAGTDLQKARARLLLRGFSFYAAAAAARLPDWQAGRRGLVRAADAAASIEQAAAASASAGRSRAIDASLADDEVLRRVTVGFWSGTDRRFWGVYPLWRVYAWAAADPGVRGAVEGLAGAGTDLGMCAHSMLRMIDGDLQPLARLDGAEGVQVESVGEDARLTKEPGEGMDPDHWRLTVGDDVEPFWNPPHAGPSGRIRIEEKDGATVVVCEGTAYATVRRRLAPIEGVVTALCFVRTPAAAKARVELRLWQICQPGHNPSPYRTTVTPRPRECVPVAVTAHLRSHPGREVDYVLLEVVVQGLEARQRLEISEAALWPAADPGEGPPDLADYENRGERAP